MAKPLTLGANAFAELDLGEQDPFFARVYALIRKVGWGQTTTYGAIAAYGNRSMRSPGFAQRRQCRQGYPLGESAVTKTWSEAPAVAARRAASAISVDSGTTRKFAGFMNAA